MLIAALVATALAQAGAQPASAPAAPPPAPPPATAPAPLRLPAGTVLQVELVDPLNSATSKLGDRFAIRLAEPVTVDGVVVAPAGATGEGEVVDASPAGMSGSQGKLIIAARYLDLNGQRVRVRGMTLAVSGESRVDLASGVRLIPYVGMASGFFLRGGEIVIPAKTRASVRTAEPVGMASETATAAASPGQAFAPGADPSKGHVYFFRPRRIGFAPMTYHVVSVGEDGKAAKDAPRLASLSNGAYVIVDLEPGIHTFNVSGPATLNKAEDRLRMEVEEGETYYIEQSFRTRVVTGGFKLVPAEKASFDEAKVKPQKVK